MEAFYLSELKVGLTSIRISGEEFHHLSKVMRLKTMDEILVMNGKGLILRCKIEAVSKSEAECSVLEEKIYQKQQFKTIALVPILKNIERFEFALEKLTEMGIDIIQPYYSQRTINKNLRFDRCKRILIASIKQSLNPFLPDLRRPLSLKEALLEFKDNSIVLFGDPTGKSIIEFREKLIDFNQENIVLLVGPEGDLTEEEKGLVKSLNALFIKLGNYRLRTETAIINLFSIVRNINPIG